MTSLKKIKEERGGIAANCDNDTPSVKEEPSSIRSDSQSSSSLRDEDAIQILPEVTFKIDTIEEESEEDEEAMATVWDADTDEQSRLISDQLARDSRSTFRQGRRLKRTVSYIHGAQKPEERPKDHYNLVYIIFFLLGLSTLLPWNFFIILTGFWDYKFRDVNVTLSGPYQRSNHTTELQYEFTSYLSIASNVPNAVFVIINAVYGQKVALRRRLWGSLTGIIFVFMVITGFSIINSDRWQRAFLVIILFLVGFANMFIAVFQGGTFGTAGKFPPEYMGSAMTGQAVGGVFPVVVNIIIIAINVREEDAGFYCFLIATLVLAMTLGLFMWISHKEFFHYYADEGVHELSEDEADVDDPPPTPDDSIRRTLHALRHSWHYCVSVYITFATTLTVFPALTVLIQSQFKGNAWADKYFNIVSNFLIFNFGDVIGRSLATLLQIPGRSKAGRWTTLIISILRIGFIPVFVFCNAAPEKRLLPVFFEHDAEFIVIMTLFSLSNGYLGNISMLHGPKTEANSQLQEETAMILIACLVLGTGSGSLLSAPLIELML